MNGDQLYLARQVLFMKVGCCFSFSFLGIPLSSYYPLKVAKVTFCTREAMGQLESCLDCCKGWLGVPPDPLVGSIAAPARRRNSSFTGSVKAPKDSAVCAAHFVLFQDSLLCV